MIGVLPPVDAALPSLIGEVMVTVGPVASTVQLTVATGPTLPYESVPWTAKLWLPSAIDVKPNEPAHGVNGAPSSEHIVDTDWQPSGPEFTVSQAKLTAPVGQVSPAWSACGLDGGVMIMTGPVASTIQVTDTDGSGFPVALTGRIVKVWLPLGSPLNVAAVVLQLTGLPSSVQVADAAPPRLYVMPPLGPVTEPAVGAEIVTPVEPVLPVGPVPPPRGAMKNVTLARLPTLPVESVPCTVSTCWPESTSENDVPMLKVVDEMQFGTTTVPASRLHTKVAGVTVSTVNETSNVEPTKPPPTGDVMVTTGPLRSTVKWTETGALTFPAASVASTVKTWLLALARPL